jgi:hypothetical protein
VQGHLLALFCSRKCPGSVILRAYDLAVALRDAAVPVIGGFQTPMEREMLAVLLRGTQPVTVVDARNARKRLPPDWKHPAMSTGSHNEHDQLEPLGLKPNTNPLTP